MYRFFSFANRFILPNFQKFSKKQLYVAKSFITKRLVLGTTIASIPMSVYDKDNDNPHDLFIYRIENLDLDNREHIEQLKKLMLLIDHEEAASFMAQLFLEKKALKNTHPAIKELLHYAIQNTKDPENTAGIMLTDFALQYARFYRIDCKSSGYRTCVPTKHDTDEIMNKVKLLLSYNVKFNKKYNHLHNFGTKEKPSYIPSMFSIYTASCDTHWTNITDLPTNDTICKYIRPFYLRILDHRMQKAVQKKKDADKHIGQYLQNIVDEPK